MVRLQRQRDISLRQALYARRSRRLEEPPPNEYDDNKCQTANRAILSAVSNGGVTTNGICASTQATYLLQQKLPINPHSRLLVLSAVFPQPARHVAHSLQAVASVQQILNVLGHDLSNIF
jgi:hypothetical protein